MSYKNIMDMPIRAFWVFNSNVNRLRAEDDMRQLQVLASAQSGEGYEDCMSGLKEELGTPTVHLDNRRDADAIDQLKNALNGL